MTLSLNVIYTPTKLTSGGKHDNFSDMKYMYIKKKYLKYSRTC